LLELTAREGHLHPNLWGEGALHAKEGGGGLGGVEVGLGSGEATQPAQRLCLELAYPLP
jgi:hypothetical protein